MFVAWGNAKAGGRLVVRNWQIGRVVLKLSGSHQLPLVDARLTFKLLVERWSRGTGKNGMESICRLKSVSCEG